MKVGADLDGRRGKRGGAPGALRVFRMGGIVLLALSVGWAALCAYRAAVLGAGAFPGVLLELSVALPPALLGASLVAFSRRRAPSPAVWPA